MNDFAVFIILHFAQFRTPLSGRLNSYAIFMILQLVPIPGLSGVHFGKESYLMLIVWIVIGSVFYVKQRNRFIKE